MTTLTTTKGSVTLPVDTYIYRKGPPMRDAAFIIGIGLMIFVGCEDVRKESWDGCAQLMHACEDTLVPAQSKLYCGMVVGTMHDGWQEDCEHFRRGQICQCITPVCIDVLWSMPNSDDEQDYADWEQFGDYDCPDMIAFLE